MKLRVRQPKHIKKDSLSIRQQARWFSLMGDLLRVGFSLKQALTFSTTLMPESTKIFEEIDMSMASGGSFSKSTRSFISQDIYYQLLLAERHGDLGQSITQIGQFLTISVKQKAKLKGLLQYPAILLSLLGILLAVLKIFIFPELSTWQNEQETQYNLFAFWPWVLLGILIGVIGISGSIIYRWLKSSAVNRATLLCQLPLIGKIYREYYAYYLITNFALLLQNGMGVREICELFASFDKKSLLNQLGSQLDQVLMNGKPPIKIIHDYPYLPQELIVFMNKGETVEELGKQLTIFSSLIFSRLIKKIEQLLVLVQPILFGIIAVVIVMMYLSIMLPIYQSMKGIY